MKIAIWLPQFHTQVHSVYGSYRSICVTIVISFSVSFSTIILNVRQNYWCHVRPILTVLSYRQNVFQNLRLVFHTFSNLHRFNTPIYTGLNRFAPVYTGFEKQFLRLRRWRGSAGSTCSYKLRAFFRHCNVLEADIWTSLFGSLPPRGTVARTPQETRGLRFASPGATSLSLESAKQTCDRRFPSSRVSVNIRNLKETRRKAWTVWLVEAILPCFGRHPLFVARDHVL